MTGSLEPRKVSGKVSVHSKRLIVGTPIQSKTGRGCVISRESSTGRLIVNKHANFVEAIRSGLSYETFEVVTSAVALPKSEVAEALGINERTLSRRSKIGTLSRDESERVLRLGRVIERAESVFGNHEDSVRWIKSKNEALGNQTPLSLLDTDIGTNCVLDTLGRIEHGVFA